MRKTSKAAFLRELADRAGTLRKLGRSQSLYEVGGSDIRLLIRYSKVHSGDRTFYGLRKSDLQELEGRPSLICFVWDGQSLPLLVPFSEFEEVFHSTVPATDDQYKVQVLLEGNATELYVAKAGRFNVEGHLGWGELDALIDSEGCTPMPELTDAQVQTILGAIGVAKSYDVWVPLADRPDLDWSIAGPFECRDVVPSGYGPVQEILSHVDVLWTERGSSSVKALFEVEHSTPIYSGLLRFNDIHLSAGQSLSRRFTIVADEARSSTFIRQLNRPTFQTSGLSSRCTFLTYGNAFAWLSRFEPPRDAS